ncbi:tRNA (adenosine(37)-N6)-threonylcarbamoyltransferase complex dimerization subunit type 1 TsaB [Mucilaginibacter ginkgonis]|uniref:tRNA (Adenosine(37)-N6)-threonylcarbamoyltransferase complex dimerization subunit type 1 TsaB n=1 Tax=Mucilaginibacter ginkgonis TaxID=2682091 RepID=A0A6I4I2S4_9SPHI|nr:tRNA (adenosine(37)-N6)-threonylcarbamoyltransferase complex dimerization subunit type 1 TsaB [Mucilaginibacter ginkgonis]QQL50616.1 tRNA (adenosine(37)-N6)-threonylcarbamoyltransferase complex dimerization subunit type 1 TsaB [Mucilaginibacter ginkgonis]
MSVILQIETATTVCSVALAKDGNVLAVKEMNERNVHAEKITLFIQDVLQQAKHTLADIAAVAVSKGPGSYTGLRIGVSAAKGLCFALDKPLIAINTLDAMAAGALVFNDQFSADAILCPMIDARRMEVYTALYDSDALPVKPTSAKIIDENSFADVRDHQLVIFGDGALKCKDVLINHNVLWLSDFENSATQLTAIALQKYQNGAFEDIAYFEPYYLKEFITTAR